ncbi:MAG: dioxygenase, partial [Gammaproteobacteria bacterium]|nr:dioxygenase [Gammaproteobacteria bacterium]
MQSLPSLFVSHGAPNLVIDSSPATGFLGAYGSALPVPRAIVVVSAHFESRQVAVSADAFPEMIFDFQGFEPELYELSYPAPGDPELAAKVVGLLRGNDIDAALQHD